MHSELKSTKQNLSGKTFIDDSPELPAYPPQTISTLLKAYDVADYPDAKLTQDNNLEFDIYAYPPQSLTTEMLARDNIEYLLKQEKAASNRRVCFLLFGPNKQPLALIIQLIDMNNDHCNKLQRLLTKENMHSTDKILAHKVICSHFKKCYQTIHALFIGSTATKALIQQLSPAVRLAYSGNFHLDFMSLPEKNSSIALTDHVLSMLHEGKTKDVNTAKIHQKNHEHIIKKFLEVLTQLRTKNNDQYNQIIDYSTRLFKYIAVTQQRNKYPATKNFIENEKLLAHDHHTKGIIYTNQFKNIAELFTLLDFRTLIQLLQFQHDPKILTEKLIAAQKKQLSDLKDWELQLNNQLTQQKQSWKNYFLCRGQQACQFVYNSSLAALGAEFLQWAGKPFTQCLKKTRAIKKLQQLAQKTSKRITAAIIGNDNLAKKSHDIIGHYINTDYSMRFLGASLGLAYTYYAGSYTFAHLMMVRILTNKVNEYVNYIVLDDDKATAIIPNPHFLLNRENCVRTMTLSITLLETIFWHKNYYLLINATGAITGSFITTNIGKNLLPELRIKPNQPPTEDQIFYLFLLSVAGHDIGYSLTDFTMGTWHHIANKLNIQENIASQLQETKSENIQDLQVDFPSLKNPLTWFNSKISFKVEWRNKNTHGNFYSKICEVCTKLLPNYHELIDQIDCDEFHIHPPRLTY